MADRGPPTPQPVPVVPATPVPLVQPPAQQAQLDQLVPPTQPGQQANGMLNWSYVRPEFSGKLEEDADAHMLRTNDWMETHNFPENMKVQRFYRELWQEKWGYGMNH